MPLKIDHIEETEEYTRAMNGIQYRLDEIDEELDANGIGMGRCHIYWEKKKELLRRRGIDWKTPAEMNPDTLFD